MAKPPKTRRGISLDPDADATRGVDELNRQADAAALSASDRERCDDLDDPLLQAIPELLSRIQQTSLDLGQELEAYKKSQKAQLRELEEQKAQLAEQTRQLQVLNRRRQTTARAGVLLSILSLVTIGAIGYHVWPHLERMSSTLDRQAATVAQPPPVVQVTDDRVDALSEGLTQIDGTVADLEKQIASLKSELEVLSASASRDASDTVVAVQYTQQPQAANVPNNPYWSGMYRMPR